MAGKRPVLLLPLLLLLPLAGGQGEDPDPIGMLCSVPRNLNITEQCRWIRNENEEGAANGCNLVSLVPYLEIFYCHSAGLRSALGDVVATALMLAAGFLWWLFLVRLVAVTAQKFVRTLTTISEGIGMKPRLAGVTLLPIGNGAPDLFSALAAVRNGNVSMAVGSAIGGSLFVTTFVVGAVVYGSGGTVDAKGMMVRDVMFLLVGSVFVFGILLDGSVYIIELVALMVLYVLYVVTVAFGHNVPPLVQAERAAWYEARSVMGKQPNVRERAKDRRAAERNAMQAADDEDRARERSESLLSLDTAAMGIAQAPDDVSLRISPAAGEPQQQSLSRTESTESMQSWESDAMDPNGMRSPRSSDDTKDSIAAWRAARTKGKSTAQHEALLDRCDRSIDLQQYCNFSHFQALLGHFLDSFVECINTVGLTRRRHRVVYAVKCTRSRKCAPRSNGAR